MKPSFFYTDEAVQAVEQVIAKQLRLGVIAEEAVRKAFGYDTVPVTRDTLRLIAPLLTMLIDDHNDGDHERFYARDVWSDEIASALEWLVDQSFNPAVAEAFAATRE